MSTKRLLDSVYAFQKSTEAKGVNMHQPLYDFTPAELQRMDDDRGECECYQIEAAREDNSNPPDGYDGREE